MDSAGQGVVTMDSGGQGVVSMDSGGQGVVTMDSGGGEVVETKEAETDEEKEQVSNSKVSQVTENSDSLPSGDVEGSNKYSLPLPPLRGSVYILPAPLSEERLGWVSEAMKVVFNQTVHWKEEGQYSEVCICVCVCVFYHTKTGPAYNCSAWTTYGCHN